MELCYMIAYDWTLQIARLPTPVRAFATAVYSPPTSPEASSSKTRFGKLDDGLTFDDFVSGEEIPTSEGERVILGDTKQ